MWAPGRVQITRVAELDPRAAEFARANTADMSEGAIVCGLVVVLALLIALLAAPTGRTPRSGFAPAGPTPVRGLVWPGRPPTATIVLTTAAEGYAAPANIGGAETAFVIDMNASGFLIADGVRRTAMHLEDYDLISELFWQTVPWYGMVGVGTRGRHWLIAKHRAQFTRGLISTLGLGPSVWRHHYAMSAVALDLRSAATPVLHIWGSYRRQRPMASVPYWGRYEGDRGTLVRLRGKTYPAFIDTSLEQCAFVGISPPAPDAPGVLTFENGQTLTVPGTSSKYWGTGARDKWVSTPHIRLGRAALRGRILYYDHMRGEFALLG